jgi:hypothetical protein
LFPDGAPRVIFDPTNAFVHPAELQWSEVYVPQPITDFLEADVFSRQGVRDADPALLPANSAVATDEADFKVSGVFEGRKLAR